MYETLEIAPQIEVSLAPEQRLQRVMDEYALKGLTVEEKPLLAYCPISLTSTPENVRGEVRRRQQWLMDVLRDCGLTPYDPASAPLSPDRGLGASPDIVYLEDSRRVGVAGLVAGWDLLPSTGMGAEWEQATTLGKKALILHDPRIRTSRMQPMRAIHISISNIEAQRERVIEMFRELQRWETGIGFEVDEEGNKNSCLLGFCTIGDGLGELQVVNLQRYIRQMFPDLAYEFDGAVDILKLHCVNSDVVEP